MVSGVEIDDCGLEFSLVCYREETRLMRCCTADIISTVEFDHTGNYLATGDKGGRVVLFERNETVCCPSTSLSTASVSILQTADVMLEKNLRV